MAATLRRRRVAAIAPGLAVGAAAPKWPGYSKTIHYEITSAGRIDYQYNPKATEGPRGDLHGVVRILTVDLGSH